MTIEQLHTALDRLRVKYERDVESIAREFMGMREAMRHAVLNRTAKKAKKEHPVKKSKKRSAALKASWTPERRRKMSKLMKALMAAKKGNE